MPHEGTPTTPAANSALALTLALALCALGGACRKQSGPTDDPESTPIEVAGEEVDAPAVCSAGCRRLEQCVPKLAQEIDGDPTVIAERLGQECDPACASFDDRGSSLALRDCLRLDSCDAYWGCVGTTTVRPWLAAVAPVGERTCENFCGQASACAIAKVCEGETESEGRGSRGGGDDADAQPEPDDEQPVDPACVQDEVRRDELDETCRMRCEATAEGSPARMELIGCIDHASCGGMLSCLDSWAETDYGDAGGLLPGVSPTCDAFCTRAIVCGAEEENLELEPEELDELKRVMTSTYIECAVQCGKDLDPDNEAARAAFEQCTSVETCVEFTACALEV